MLSYADVVATLAFAIAAGTASFQAYAAFRWNHPVLTVTGDFGYTVEVRSGGTSNIYGWMFSIFATNAGESPTRVLDAHWELELKGGLKAIVRGTDFANGSFEVEYENETIVWPGELTPAIPLTLSKFDAAQWLFIRDSNFHRMIEEAVRGRPVVEYVARKRRKSSDTGKPNTIRCAGEWRSLRPAEAKAALRTIPEC